LNGATYLIQGGDALKYVLLLRESYDKK